MTISQDSIYYETYGHVTDDVTCRKWRLFKDRNPRSAHTSSPTGLSSLSLTKRRYCDAQRHAVMLCACVSAVLVSMVKVMCCIQCCLVFVDRQGCVNIVLFVMGFVFSLFHSTVLQDDAWEAVGTK